MDKLDKDEERIMWNDEELIRRICQMAHEMNYVPYTTTQGFYLSVKEGKYLGWKHDVMLNVKFIYDEVCTNRSISTNDLRKIADIIDAIRIGFKGQS